VKDFLGNEYGVGDKVLYAAMSGRSVTMVLAEVVRIFEAPKYGQAYEKVDELGPDDKEIHVSVQPLSSSRWKQHYGRTRYIDSRTGKGIDPFSGKGKHMTGDYYEHRETGKRVYRSDADQHPEFPRFYGYEWGTPEKQVPGYRFVKQEFKNYVNRIEDGPKPVTLYITDNIVKWVGTCEPDESESN
jgi:hypothetical protein